MSDSPDLPELPKLPFGLSWGDGVPLQPEPDEDDLWLKWASNEFLPVRIVSPKSLDYYGHWFTAVGAYRLCLAQRDAQRRVISTAACPLCPRPASELPSGRAQASAARIRHILTVETPDGSQRIWEFSEAVARQLAQITGWQRSPAGIVTRTHELAGLRLILSRLPPRSNGAVVIQLDPEPDPRGDMPGPIDAAAYVSECWRRAALRDGKAMPKLPGFG